MINCLGYTVFTPRVSEFGKIQPFRRKNRFSVYFTGYLWEKDASSEVYGVIGNWSTLEAPGGRTVRNKKFIMEI